MHAQLGDLVKVHYIGKLEDGTIFDSTINNQPFELTLGNGQAVPGFEIGIVGMEVGDKKELKVSYEDGFGPRNEEYREEIKRSALPIGLKVEKGVQLRVPHIDGSFIRATILEIGTDMIILDTNHPLAGKNLVFEVELLHITRK